MGFRRADNHWPRRGRMREIRRNAATVRDVLILVWNEASPFVRWRLVLVIVLVIVASTLMPVGPLALKLLVDPFTGATPEGAYPVVVLVGLYVLSQWFSRSLGELRGLVYARAERRMYKTITARVFAHVLNLPLRFHIERKTGAIIQTLENGLQGYQSILHHVVFT